MSYKSCILLILKNPVNPVDSLKRSTLFADDWALHKIR